MLNFKQDIVNCKYLIIDYLKTLINMLSMKKFLFKYTKELK